MQLARQDQREGGRVKEETKREIYHSPQWCWLVESGWHTLTVDDPDEHGDRWCVLIRSHDHIGRMVL